MELNDVSQLILHQTSENFDNNNNNNNNNQNIVDDNNVFRSAKSIQMIVVPGEQIVFF